MSLGLPGHLVQQTLARALARAAHWFALTCLMAAAVSVSILSLDRSPELWITTVVVVAMGALLVLFTRHRRIALAVAYLIVGTLGVYVFTLTVLGVPDVFPTSNMFLAALPKMALVMVGGAGSTALGGVLWTQRFRFPERRLMRPAHEEHEPTQAARTRRDRGSIRLSAPGPARCSETRTITMTAIAIDVWVSGTLGTSSRSVSAIGTSSHSQRPLRATNGNSSSAYQG